MIIDNQGRIFGKWNVIDFLVIMFLLIAVLPCIYFGYKINTQKMPPASVPTYYTMNKPCPNCQAVIEIRIDKGIAAPKFHSMTCNHCEVEVRITLADKKPARRTRNWYNIFRYTKGKYYGRKTVH